MSRYGIDWDKGEEGLTEEDYDKIMVETTKIIEEGNADIDLLSGAFYDRGVLYNKRGEYEKAVADYTASIHIYNDFWPAYYNRGRLYAFNRQYDESLSDMNDVLRISPDNNEALNLIKIIKRAKAAKEKAEKSL